MTDLREAAEGLLRALVDDDDRPDDDVDALIWMRRLRAALDDPAPDPRVVEAFDLLGGMWSWHENKDDPNSYLYTGNTWYLRAGRLLRDVVGRPAQPPATSEVPA